MKNTKKILLLFILCVIGIGFAWTIYRNYSFNGNIVVKKDLSKLVYFDVDFSNENIINGSVSFSDDKRKMYFTGNKFMNLGDKSSIKYRLKNESNYNVRVIAFDCKNECDYTYYNSDECKEYIGVNQINNIKVGDIISANSSSNNYNEINYSLDKSITNINYNNKDYPYTMKTTCYFDVEAVK